jgi:MoxR-like ATPase
MESNLRESLLKIMNEYLQAKREPFGSHPLGTFVRNDVPVEFTRLPFVPQSDYVVTGSVGQGVWAHVPWIAIMNRFVTVSTQRGYYIVYLFSEDMSSVYLTLAQGVTETSREAMYKIKEEIRESVALSSKVRKDDDFYLGNSPRAKAYAQSTALYIPYEYENMPDESQLVADLEEMIIIYENFISIKNGSVPSRYEGDIMSEDPHDVTREKFEYLSYNDLVSHIYSFIKGKGFYYEKEEIINLFLSLKTKPFVIISGISGTGKTKIVQWFAESVGATEKNGQFSLIPIRPDWNDGSDLLGYVDIKGEFKEGPLTKVIKNAHQNPELPYFVLLDEMNLARVEYYFSDILSVMESRKWENGEIVSSTLLSSDIYGEDVTLPNNLYIIGTVNMDETTHPFSKKVLDRANTIEFNRVNLGNLAFLTELEEVEPKVIGQDRFASKYLHLKDVYKENKEIVARATDELVRINESLQLINAHVGYRVRDEICFYLAYNENSNLMKFENAFDHCILQKILPRIAGSDTRVEQLLRGLYSLFANQDYEEDGQNDIQNAKYPRSAAKGAEMLGRLRNDGFTSFWIS